MGKMTQDKGENKAIGKRSRHVCLQYLECSNLSPLKTHKALWKQPINKRIGGREGEERPDAATLQYFTGISHYLLRLLLNVMVFLARAELSEQV